MCVLARSHVVTTAYVRKGKHVVNVGVHSCLRIISPLVSLSLSLFLFCTVSSISPVLSPYLPLLSLSLFPLLLPPPPSLSLSLSCLLSSPAVLPSPLSPAPDRPRTREGILSSFYSSSKPVIVDTMARNGCFTPPLARELGNKLAAGLISLSRRMAVPTLRLRRQGPDAVGRRRVRGGGGEGEGGIPRRAGSEDTGRNRVPGTPQDQWLSSLARSRARGASLKTGQSRLK